MMVALNAAPGTHAVQFYEGERFLQRAASNYFGPGLAAGEPLVMIGKPRAFQAVAERVAADYGMTVVEAAARIQFIDVDAALASFMDGITPNPERFAQSYAALMASIPRRHTGETIWFFGEMAGQLCKEGNLAGAVQIEELWNAVSARDRMSVVCAYSLEGFDDDLTANQLRAVCRHHTHVIPAEGFADAPDDRARLEQVAMLQQRARALDRALARERPALPAPEPAVAAATVYVIDDDASVRRSLARLLASIDLEVRTFDSAETFLAEVDGASSGCVIVDVQLVGMSGPDLQSRMASTQWAMPIIAMSGSHDMQVETEALRLGAAAFLRKPFDAQALIDAIGRAMS